MMSRVDLGGHVVETEDQGALKCVFARIYAFCQYVSDHNRSPRIDEEISNETKLYEASCDQRIFKISFSSSCCIILIYLRSTNLSGSKQELSCRWLLKFLVQFQQYAEPRGLVVYFLERVCGHCCSGEYTVGSTALYPIVR